jgi:hypothetical protein
MACLNQQVIKSIMKKLLGILVLGLLWCNGVLANELNANSFFNKFNMRSIYSSMGPQLKFWCGSYPFEFFKLEKQNNQSITLIRDDTQFWIIKFLKNNKIELTDQITDGTYLTNDVYELKYISAMNEWWSIDTANSGKLNIPEGENCKKLSSQSANTDEFKDGEYIGQEAFTDEYGNTYVGEWKDGKYNGQGTQTFSSGHKYVGEFKNGKKHGQGTITYPSGGKYVGGWKDGEFHGQGTFTFAGGNKYVGEFKDSSRNGQGTLTYVDGTVEKGIWENGELVEPN